MDAPQQGNFVLCHLYDGKMISPRTMASRYCSLNAKPCTENKANREQNRTRQLASENPFKVHVTLAGATMTTRNALNVTHVEGFNGHLTILLHSLRTYLLIYY